MIRRIWFLAGVALVCGCSTANEKKIAEYKAEEKPLKAYEINYEVVDAFGVGDPAEGFNRLMFDVNDFFMMWIFKPVGYVYGSIMPQPAIECINNFTDNIAFPGRLVNNLFQAEFKGAGKETVRFLTNSTIGIGGLFDPAWNWFGMYKNDEDFGQTFAVWGIGPGCFLTLPGMGPTTVRDAVGSAFDAVIDPKTYFYGGQAFTFLNRGMAGFGMYESVRNEYADPYRQLRDMWVIDRQMKIENWYKKSHDEVEIQGFTGSFVSPIFNDTTPEGAIYPVTELEGFISVSTPNDTLRTVKFGVIDSKSLWAYLSPFNGSFARAEYNNSIKIADSGESMRYRYWPESTKDNSAPIVVVIPGIGVNCNSQAVAALAEVYHKQGYAVIGMSNPFNWQYVNSAGKDYMPGYTPDDIKLLKRYILEIEADVKKRYNLNPSERIGVGYSLGALESIYIAATDDYAREANFEFYEKENGKKFFFDEVIAINPPVDLLRGVEQLDSFYKLGESLTVDEFKFVAKDAMNKFVRYSATPNNYEISLLPKQTFSATAFADYLELRKQAFNGSDTLASFMIGYMFRRNLSDMLVTLNRKNNLEKVAPYSYWDWSSAYETISNISFNSYVEDYLIPHKNELSGETLTLSEMNYYSSMFRIDEQLARNKHIKVIHSRNDFLLSEGERIWLNRQMGDRVIFFNGGGHLGNMPHWQFRNQLVNFLDKNR